MPERILVVDDDRDICRSIEVILRLEGYDVCIANEGEEAIEQATRIQPDLVLLDMMMPGIDGYEVTKRLRHDPRTATASIIMLTARALPADKVLGLTAGCDDYIVKPFDPSELVARVHSALRRSRQMREVSPLTGLPGNFQISAELERLVDQEAEEFAVLYADLDDFKAYNDHYGFMRGDEAIRATGRLLTDSLARHRTSPSFAGHIGGDDFVLVTAAKGSEALAQDIVGNFDVLASSLYDEEDCQRGFIEVPDRRGVLHHYPFLSISIGVANSAVRPIRTQWEASAVASEMKAVAKRKVGSSYEIDRRRA
ncbi:MAG: Transcriptional regulatory protein WalR [Acidimicrobiales bacterium]|nr:Transcriptional regulatory protein WalR [Acidimicrobiales bacterium]